MNHPSTSEDEQQIKQTYSDIDFHSAVCSLLYLAYNTRVDILFIVCKLAKACSCPGMKDYEALIWLLGYLQDRPNLANMFYTDVCSSPVYKMCISQRIQPSDLLVFTDASWQDCPDTGCSTVGYLIFYQGGIIDANSTVPTPVAMSSSEAELMGACTGCMAVAHIRMLLYDIEYLGTKQWTSAFQNLAQAPVIVMVDNQATVKIAASKKLTRKTRHIERRFHFVCQGTEIGVHIIVWIPANLQLADITTKTQEATVIDPRVTIVMYTLPIHLTRE
jgi:hypothetical protein